MDNRNAIVVENLAAGYGAVRVVEQVSMTVGAGEIVVLLGTNGNGKSTLIKCLMGLLRPTAGNVYFNLDGHRYDASRMAPEDIVALGVTLVPEGRRLFPRLTVEENLSLGAYRAAARARTAQNLDYCYQTFPQLAARRAQLAGSLSGGEQQMLALARALMSAPRILLIDEPSVGLAPILVSHVIDKIRELKIERDLTVLMAEQNFHQAIKIADRGYVIVHGRIAHEGAAAALRDNELIRRFYLGL